MKNSSYEKAKSFECINDIALKGEIVVYGSTYMSNFPFYEFTNKNRLDAAIYNRSIPSLTIEEAVELLGPCVLGLNPSKIFLHLGEDEELNQNSCPKYKKIIEQLKSALPNSSIYIIGIRGETETVKSFNKEIEAMCGEQSVVFIPLDRNKSGNFKDLFRQLCHYFRSRPISFCDAFFLTEVF